MKLSLLMASAVSAAMSFGGHAATIERTFDVTASDFILNSGSNIPAAVDPVELNFTLVFDPLAVITRTTAGLTINSFNLPYSTTYANNASGTLTIATDANVGSCDNPPNSYCFFINDPAGASPTVNFVNQTTSSGFWVASAITVSASAIVPEPSTWALMLIGFGGVGWVAYRRGQARALAA